MNKPEVCPFKAGDKVRVFGSFVSDHGYEVYHTPMCLRLEPKTTYIGMEGIVDRIDGDYTQSAPDARVFFDNGDYDYIDLCYLVNLSKPSKKKKPLTPQCRTLLRHLQKGHTITQRSALLDFGVAALPRRIADLKEHGHNIKSVMEHNKLTDQRYARYSLVEEAS